MTEALDSKVEPGTPAGTQPDAGKPPVEKPTVEPKKVETKVEPKPEPKPEPKVEPKVEPRAAKRVADDEDDDEETDKVPDTTELVMSKRGLNSRLSRHVNKTLKAAGIQNLDELKQIKTRYDETVAAAEEKRLADMSELEREKELRSKAEKEKDDLRAEMDSLKVATIVREQQREVSDAAVEHFKPKYVKQVSRELADHVQALDDKEIEELPEDYISKWMKKYAEENPELTTAFTASKSSDETVRKIPLTNGAKTKNAGNPQPSGGKLPDKPKTDKDWEKYKKESGLSF